MGELQLEERGEGVLLATISNPPHGLMDDEIVDGLEALAARADRDPELTGVVLTGAHPERFVAHYDIAELLAASRAAPSVRPAAARASLGAVGALRRIPGAASALERTPAAGLSQAERFGEVLARLGSVGAVVVAAINGSAQGGGCELALACDLRLMADGPFLIGQPEILFGFPPGGGGTQRLARLLGSGPALQLCLDGGPLTPEQAKELGLVDELAPPAELVDRALALATRLARRPKAAIAGVKRAVNVGGSLPLAAGLRLERAELMSAIVSDDADAAMAAYVDGLERSGELPAYDPEALQRALEDGRFR
ncbi:MAG: enoyl-CoA hydratase/isomerase family protein [Solirubrobacterales bacterium]|nr:enoyl-CoA hydratase/isomerase family protein [Solirubrobacterales bacterium]